MTTPDNQTPASAVSGNLPIANGGTGSLTPVAVALTPGSSKLTPTQHLKAFLDGLLNDVNTVGKDLWNDNKTIFIVLIPLIAVIFGRNLLMSLIVSNAKKTIMNATQQDTKLASQENAANTQADQLIKTADSLPSQEQPVTEDWYTKK